MKYLLAIITLSLCQLTFAGTVYKWVDGSGHTQYTESPPPKHGKLSKTTTYKNAKSSDYASISDTEDLETLRLRAIEGARRAKEQAERDAAQAHRDMAEALAGNKAISNR